MKKLRADVPGSPEAIEARLEEMERRLDRLRSIYESYFSGIEKAPPNVPRRELNRLMVEMQQEHIRNSGLRFRFQSLQQRWVLMTTYWNRTMREIENGTYRRDLARVNARLAKRGQVLSEQEAIALGIPAGRAKAFVDAQARLAARREQSAQRAAETNTLPASAEAAADEWNQAERTVASAPPQSMEGPQPPAVATPTPISITPPPVPLLPRTTVSVNAHTRADQTATHTTTAPSATRTNAVPGVTEDGLQSFWKRYVDAHVQHSGAPPKVSFEQMRTKLAQELPRVMQAKNCASLDLDVAIENGKVMLKARPRR